MGSEMESPTDQPTTEDWSGRLAKLASLLLGATAIGAALAFYLGWRYEKAYVEEWGLSFSAFTYSPYELMVASWVTLIWAASFPLGIVMGEMMRPAMFGVSPFPPLSNQPVPVTKGMVVFTVLAIVGTLGLFAYAVFTADLAFALTLIWIYVASMAAVAWQSARSGSVGARWVLLVLGVLSLWLLVTVAPEAVGQRDAKEDRNEPEQLPKVEVTLNHPLGLGEVVSRGNQIVTGPWRLLRVNDGNLWLAPDQKGAEQVVQIQSSDVAAITYLRD